MKTENMNDDSISRSELIKAIKDKYNYASATAFLLTMKDISPQDVVYQILTIIDNISNDGAQEDLGKWITHADFHDSIKFGCNQCGNLANIKSRFCPNCGKRMNLRRGAKHEVN